MHDNYGLDCLNMYACISPLQSEILCLNISNHVTYKRNFMILPDVVVGGVVILFLNFDLSARHVFIELYTLKRGKKKGPQPSLHGFLIFVIKIINK